MMYTLGTILTLKTASLRGIVESRDTIRANTRHVGENGVKVVVEKNERYAL